MLAQVFPDDPGIGEPIAILEQARYFGRGARAAGRAARSRRVKDERIVDGQCGPALVPRLAAEGQLPGMTDWMRLTRDSAL